MSDLAASSAAYPCAPTPSAGPVVEALEGRLTDLGGFSVRRLLPRSRRRLVGPWCFLDGFGPGDLGASRPLDVPPHPHIGLQTVSWLLEGEILHKDSLGETGLARPGVLNLMTAGRGIAHSEESPPGGGGRLDGVQLWVALPDTHRGTAPSFEQHESLPVLEHDRARVTLIQGRLAGQTSPAQAFWPVVGAELALEAGATLRLEVDPDFEHALVPLRGEAGLGDTRLVPGTLYYLGCGRRALEVSAGEGPAVLLLIGGAPFEESVLMWWNFVAREPGEMEEARADWEAGRRFGPVTAYAGERLSAPPLGRLARRQR